MEIISKNLKTIVDSETGGNIHKFSNDYLGEERSDKLRAWINGVKNPNLKEIDSFRMKLKKKTGKELNLNWLVYDKGDMFVDYDFYIYENQNLRKELENVNQEYSSFKKMALSNFNDVDMNSRFVDDLDELSKLDDVTRNLFLGNSYYSEIIGNA